jgi:FkbM family methyltransferase
MPSYKFVPVNIRSRLIKILNLSNILSETTISKAFLSLLTNRPIVYNGFELSNYGVWLASNYKDKTFDFAIRSYRNGLDKILKSISEDFNFVDIGANQGVFTLVAAKNRFCKRIYCFEPNLKVLGNLQRNLEFNNVLNHEIHKVAITKTDGVLKFFVPEYHSGAGHVVANDSNYNQEINSISRNSLNVIFEKVQHPLFIKIDVQGMELEVIIELLNSNLNCKIGYLFVEVDLNYGHFKDISQILSDNNFSEVSRFGSKSYFDIFYKRL